MKNYFSITTLAGTTDMIYNMSRNNPGSFGERARSLSERIGSCFFYGGTL